MKYDAQKLKADAQFDVTYPNLKNNLGGLMPKFNSFVFNTLLNYK